MPRRGAPPRWSAGTHGKSAAVRAARRRSVLPSGRRARGDPTRSWPGRSLARRSSGRARCLRRGRVGRAPGRGGRWQTTSTPSRSAGTGAPRRARTGLASHRQTRPARGAAGRTRLRCHPEPRPRRALPCPRSTCTRCRWRCRRGSRRWQASSSRTQPKQAQPGPPRGSLSAFLLWDVAPWEVQ